MTYEAAIYHLPVKAGDKERSVNKLEEAARADAEVARHFVVRRFIAQDGEIGIGPASREFDQPGVQNVPILERPVGMPASLAIPHQEELRGIAGHVGGSRHHRTARFGVFDEIGFFLDYLLFGETGMRTSRRYDRFRDSQVSRRIAGAVQQQPPIG